MQSGYAVQRCDLAGLMLGFAALSPTLAAEHGDAAASAAVTERDAWWFGIVAA